VIEYKGYFSTVNRKQDGKYTGCVSGIDVSGVEIKAGSLCQLRKIFESVIDEFLRNTSPKNSHGASVGDPESRNN